MAAAKTPVPPILDNETVEVSPAVVISTISTVCPKSRSWSAIIPACVVASALRRVPSLMLMTFTADLRSREGPIRQPPHADRDRRARAVRGRSHPPHPPPQEPWLGRLDCAEASQRPGGP